MKKEAKFPGQDPGRQLAHMALAKGTWKRQGKCKTLQKVLPGPRSSTMPTSATPFPLRSALASPVMTRWSDCQRQPSLPEKWASGGGRGGSVLSMTPSDSSGTRASMVLQEPAIQRARCTHWAQGCQGAEMRIWCLDLCMVVKHLQVGVSH